MSGENPERAASPVRVARARLWIALVAILLLAAFLRLYRLDVTPPGLHYDEAFNALQARDVLRGVNRPIFFTGNFGEEPLQMYVEAVLFGLGGESPWTARLSEVFLGLLLIPALFFCARVFFLRQPLVALTAAFIGATSYWAINFSRIGIETNSLPFLLTLSAGAVALAQRRGGMKWGLAAGLLLGASVYTYLASRVWLVAVPLWFAYLALLHRAQLRVRLRAWLALAVFAALTLAPLALFFAANPVALTGRAGQVLTPDQLTGNLARTAGMFFLSGDADPRDNLPGRPILDPFLAPVFALGLIVCSVRARKPPYALLLIWLVMMTLPSAVTEFAPNFRRAIGALPAVALICAVGLNWVVEVCGLKLADWSKPTGRGSHVAGLSGQARTLGGRLGGPVVLGAVLVLGLAFSAWSSAHDYFVEWANGTGLYYSFDAGLLEVAKALAGRPATEQLCLSPDYHAHPTVLWALDGRPFSTFDGRRVAVLPNSAVPATCAIITYEDQQFSPARFFSGAQHLATIYDFEPKPYAEIFRIPAGIVSRLQPQHLLDARVGSAVRVLGYDLTRAGERIDLKIYWRDEAPLGDDYTVFVHLLGLTNPATDSPVWAQDDAQPGAGTYPTLRWRVGETVIDPYTLSLPAAAPAAAFQVEVGMYLLSTGTRLPVFVNGQRAAEDRLLLGQITR